MTEESSKSEQGLDLSQIFSQFIADQKGAIGYYKLRTFVQKHISDEFERGDALASIDILFAISDGVPILERPLGAEELKQMFDIAWNSLSRDIEEMGPRAKLRLRGALNSNRLVPPIERNLELIYG